MKAILISIKPEWVEKILNGEKTVEIRKTAPKVDLPIDVYIYCAKDDSNLLVIHDDGEMAIATKAQWSDAVGSYGRAVNGKIVGKFTLSKIDYLGNVAADNWEQLIGSAHEHHKQLVKQSCLTEQELRAYGGKYAWHIDNLKIFDKPMELSELASRAYMLCAVCELEKHKEAKSNCWRCGGTEFNPMPLASPPRSWQYVEASV